MESGTSSGLSITVRNLNKAYGAHTALEDVNLEVRSGELITLLGPSGSGKTTFLMTLAGFVRPSTGSILFGAQQVAAWPAHKRNVGMVFQSFALFPHMTVGRNIGYALRARGVSTKEIGRRVDEALELVRLSGLQSRRIDQLSGGQKQRVALARAIVFRPKILLMDEPLSALDKNLREMMQVEIRNLQRDLGITTVSVTHDQREALSMGDRVAVFNAGRLIQVDTPEALYNHPSTGFVASFLGETNLEPVEIENSAAFYRGQRLKLSVPLPTRASQQNFLVLRPERVSILDDFNSDKYNCFRARVKEVVFQGDTILVNAVLESGTTVAIRKSSISPSSAAGMEVNSEIIIGLHQDNTIIVSKC